MEHAIALCSEYTHRYGKIHGSQSVIEWCAAHGGKPKTGGLTDFAQAMPDQYKQKDAVAAYRAYYLAEKLRFAKWAPRAVAPLWIND